MAKYLKFYINFVKSITFYCFLSKKYFFIFINAIIQKIELSIKKKKNFISQSLLCSKINNFKKKLAY